MKQSSLEAALHDVAEAKEAIEELRRIIRRKRLAKAPTDAERMRLKEARARLDRASALLQALEPQPVS